MPGFGEGPFGEGAFGEWYWSLFNFVENIPEVYKQQDAEADGVLRALMEGVSPSLDNIRQLIRDFDILRDPLRCPVETEFLQPVIVLKTEVLDDGTSRVFISGGASGEKFVGLRPGMVLIDLRSLRFTIASVVSSARAGEVEDPPTDPYTSEPVYKHFIVYNIGQVSTEFVPFVSGVQVDKENPSVFFPLLDPGDDGIEESPYVFTLANVPVRNRVTVEWTENLGVDEREGFFTNEGVPGGDLSDTSTIDFDTGDLSLDTGRSTPIDADTIRVTYTTGYSGATPLDEQEDGEIRAQNILAFLAGDYGINLDRNDPEVLQRSYVNNAYQLWNLKGTGDGYDVLGRLAGYYVEAQALHKVTESIALGLPPEGVFQFPPVTGPYYTTMAPRRALFDEIVLDAMPLDLLCCEDDYPHVDQVVVVDSVTLLSGEGSRKRNLVVVSTAAPEDSYFTCGLLTDSATVEFEPENLQRIDETSYRFEVVNFAVPTLGAATMTWHVLKSDVSIAVPDITALGVQLFGYTGIRYRIETFVADPIVSGVGNWKFIDSEGSASLIETWELVTGNIYRFEFVSEDPPAIGPGRIFYDCEIVTSCSFCRASSIVVRISPTDLLTSEFPEALDGQALERLILRLKQMIPAHVRIAAFVFDPGPAVATWGPIAASGSTSSPTAALALYGALYDTNDFPADAIPVDTAPILAISEVTITNENVFEEYIGASDPIVAGTWTATGLWQVIEYRSSTQFRSFNYGQGDSGRFGEVGAVAPNYDTGGATLGVLTSPTIPGISAGNTAVTLRLRHFADMRGTVATDVPEIRVVSTGLAVLQTITKTNLGIAAAGSTGGIFVTVSFDIQSAVEGAGAFFLEFEFDNGATSTSGVTGECWYIDDVEVQVTP